MVQDSADSDKVGVLEKRTHLLLLAAGLLLYNAAWIYVSYIRYTSLNYSVWDLGVNYERAWQVIHGSLTTIPDLNISSDMFFMLGFPAVNWLDL